MLLKISYVFTNLRQQSRRHQRYDNNQNTENNPVVSEDLETVTLDEIHQEADNNQRYHERNHHAG